MGRQVFSGALPLFPSLPIPLSSIPTHLPPSFLLLVRLAKRAVSFCAQGFFSRGIWRAGGREDGREGGCEGGQE